MGENCKSDLKQWLTPFVCAHLRKTRVWMCPAHIAGLIRAGNRRSVQPMAARDEEVGYDQLHHLIVNEVCRLAALASMMAVIG